jgi:hypothetical protein
LLHLAMPVGTPSPPGKKTLFQPFHLGKHRLQFYILILSEEQNISISISAKATTTKTDR